MAKYTLSRLLLLIPTLIGMSLLIFLMLRLLPGYIVDILVGSDPTVSSSAREQLREAMGLTAPLPVQYLTWLGNLFQGDLGTSMRSGKPVSELLLASLPITVELAVLATLIATAVAIPLGVISAVRRDTGVDFAARVGGLIGLSLPSFWIATLALLFTSKVFGWVPKTRFISPFEDPFGNLQQMILPALALAIQLMAIEMRMTRTTMLEVLGQDYVRTARAKGLSEQLVILRHGFRNAAIPLVTLMALDVPFLFTGALFTEVIFAWPGMGRLFYAAAERRDYGILMAIIMITSTLIILANILADVLYAVLDPRIRLK
ncbi:MAG: ABC transporter permease [Thermomicrobiales bacterium]|nr:ABC transporter permease [Thermomicrobiales bacterium]